MTQSDSNVTFSGTEHWTKKGDVNLFLWNKAPDGSPKGTVLFVHGSSMASKPTFDLQVPGRPFSSVMDWFVSQEYVDPERVGLQGFSMGSLIGAHVAGTDPRVAAFGSWSGAIHDGDQSFYDETMLADCEAAGGRVDLDLGWRTIQHSCDFFSSMLAATALSDLAPFARSMLLVVGSEDTVVLPSVSQNVAVSTASGDVTIEVIEGADHIFNVLTDDQALAEQAIAATAEWFAVKLWLAPLLKG